MLEEAVQYVKFLQLQIKVTTWLSFLLWLHLKFIFEKTQQLILFPTFEFEQLLSSDDLWMYAPIAYNGMNIGLELNINITKQEKKCIS